MTEQELALILASHKKWLKGDKEGRCADLNHADLSHTDLSLANLYRANLNYADLRCANLRCADLRYADLSCADLSHADLSHADLSYASLRYSNLRGANLRGTNLSRADLDFSCLPLWCGSLRAQFDDKHIIQIIYHAVKAGLNSSNVSKEVKTELMKLIDFANKFHRANECGKIIYIKEETNENKEATKN